MITSAKIQRLSSQKKPELLAPAGDLERAKIAFIYGADSVYVGGNILSLRARASTFTLEDIAEASRFAHDLNKRLYVTVNIVPHDEDLIYLTDYLLRLNDIGVDALICSDPFVIEQALAHTTIPVHLSTQASPTNSLLINYWHDRGIKRVVLARECTLEEIRVIRKNTHAELEVFIHGGMCVSYSGRCTLSNYMTGRDANRGGCAHSCRWKYRLSRDGIQETDDFWMASKDLETLAIIPDLFDLSIDSLKIEGRMKSIHYIATVTKTYRQVIDDFAGGQLRPTADYKAMMMKAENRASAPGFLNGVPDESGQINSDICTGPVQNFIGIVREILPDQRQALIETRNAFTILDKLEVFSPDRPDTILDLKTIKTEDGTPRTCSTRPLSRLLIETPTQMKPYDILRKVIE